MPTVISLREKGVIYRDIAAYLSNLIFHQRDPRRNGRKPCNIRAEYMAEIRHWALGAIQ